MPRRDDINTILILGSGPIVIGQGCEFDYSGAQACKSLRDEGFRVVLVNSNPATIMTDPGMSDRTYIEPITPDAVRKVLIKERDLGNPIDAILPTLGGQTALNCACALFDDGVLDEFGVEMIGATRAVIHRAEDRQAFNDICESIGLATPESKTVNTLEEALEYLEVIGTPAIVRPAFTLGGWGGGIAYNREEFAELIQRGLGASMINQVQVDRSLIGWKEYELEVVRDRRDNCVIVCGIENIDAMGVHTGDSITVAPILTLTDKEYQTLRDAAIAIMRAVGVETGGSNVQFAVNPNPESGSDGTKRFEFVVVEMNPRVSRSSALASKATGFPIAKIAAKLAIGYTLDELRNDITGTTSACFEPAIDYVVTKMPRWTFEKFPEADETLTTQMKSVGEAMAIGRTFKESLQKVIRSMDIKRFGLGLDRNDNWLAARRATEGRAADGAPIEWPIAEDKLTRKLAVPSQGRLYYIRYAFKMGWSIERVNQLTGIDPFFLDQIQQLVEFEDELCVVDSLDALPDDTLFRAKQYGYSDAQLAHLYLGTISAETILKVRAHRKHRFIEPVFKQVDTCAAEFEAVTPYYYSTYERGHRHVLDSGASAFAAEDELANRMSCRSPLIVDFADALTSDAPFEKGYEGNFVPDDLLLQLQSACKQRGVCELALVMTYPWRTNEEHGWGIAAIDCERRIWLADFPTGLNPRLQGLGAQYDHNSHHDVWMPGDSIYPQESEARLEAWLGSRASGNNAAKERVIILGGGPNRIGQGIEFDYCCTHAALAARELGFESVMINSNPETVSTDYDTSDLLFFEPLTLEDVLNVVENLGAVHGVVVQFGGQTPLNLAHGLALAGAPLIGTSLDSIDLAEDRDRFDNLLERLDLKHPESGIARSLDEAAEIAERIGFPVLVRPSYVLGGRGMEICSDDAALRHYMTSAVDISDLDGAPILIDKFLDNATEVDVDVIADFTPTISSSDNDEGQAIVCGVMEHIEQAGVHSGDSGCVIPPYSLSKPTVDRIRTIARTLAKELRINGLMNMQLAVRDDEISIIEVNPRASRTVPFVAKATHVPWPAIAAKVMMGKTLDELGAIEVPETGAIAVKESVFPFQKFPGVDVVLGPEMRSTGEVMGIDVSMPAAYLKALQAAGTSLPRDGGVFISVNEKDREDIVDVARSLLAMGYTVYTTAGTGGALRRHGMKPTVLPKIGAGARPNVLDLMANDEISLIINTPTRTGWRTDEGRIRATAVRLGIPMITTVTGARASVGAIQSLRAGDWDVAALQDFAPHKTEVVL